jgi:hypothetical protein
MISSYKKSQSALEFLGITMTILFLFTILFASVYENIADKVSENKNSEIKEIAYIIQDEVNLASKSTEGYNREFNIPNKIDGEEYYVNISGDMIIVKSIDNKHAISVPIPTISGNVVKGNNLIKKQDGNIILNP